MSALAAPWQQLVGYLRRPLSDDRPPPTAPLDQLLFGLAQPLYAFRVLRQPEIWRAALLPALLLCLFCALLAALEGPFWRTFYRTFAVLAPLPSIVLANHYARLAAAAHRDLGLGACQPRLQSLWTAAMLALRMAVLVAVAIAPVLLFKAVPGLGWIVVAVAGALWSLLWIVVEALDSARVLPPPPPATAAAEPPPPHWFFPRALASGPAQVPVLGWWVRRFLGVCRWLCRPWREELALCEEHPVLFLGFALSTALLLCTPVLNLAFRPVIIIAAVHTLGCLRRL